ncbi:MAG: hypothetical protein LBK63_05380 [Treponema sp.]|jgi:hypothetical protein|nr:hypothetical protein [Treponema sp.]
MKTHTSIHFVILMPHAGLAAPLRDQSRFLFRAGISGAWSFPQAAPLARLKRPLTGAELRDLAGALREATLSRDGKIALGKPALVPCPGFHSFFGPVLDLPPLPCPAVLQAFPVLVVAAALAAPADEPLLGRIQDIPPMRPGFFRTARVSNLSLKPLEGAFPADSVPGPAENYSFEWRLGKPRWLPSLRSLSPKRGGQDGV